MNKILCIFTALTLAFLSACSYSGPATDDPQTQTSYQSYKDIPGVTQDDVDALEELLVKYPRLVYGFDISADSFIREDGTVGGFAPLLCERMSELFGFEIELYTCDWSELIDRTLSHEIDLVGDLTATAERRQSFLMTDAMIQRSVKMFTDRNSADLGIIAKHRPLKCAFLEFSTTYDTVADTWEMPFEPVFVDNTSDIPVLLESGEIDVFIEEGIVEAAFDPYDFIRSEEYFPLTYSPVSLATGNPELAPIIDIMQKYLENGGSYELATLHTEGYSDYLKNKLAKALTTDEKDYILLHNSEDTAIKTACEFDNYPASFYNTKEKEYQGIALDTLNQISDLTGLVFKVGNETYELWPDLLEGLENGEYSIVTELIWTKNRENRFLWTDEPYTTDKYALISLADYPDVDINRIMFSKVGLIKDSAFSDVYFEWFPNSENTVLYEGTDDAVAGLENGEIDLLMSTQNLLLHLTNYLEKPGFKANIVFNYSTSSHFGLNKDEDTLCSIIDKAQLYVDTDAIMGSWHRKVFDYESKMLRDMLPYVMAFLFIVSLTLVIVIILLIRHRHNNKNLDRIVNQRTNELASQADTLERRLEQQKLMAALSQNFITAGDIDEKITESLKLIGGFLDVCRVMLLKYEDSKMQYLYEWNNESRDVKSKLGTVLKIGAEEMPLIVAYSKRVIDNFSLDDLDDESKSDFLERYKLDDLKNTIMIPVYSGGEFWGVLEFDHCTMYSPWSQSDITLGEMVAGVLSGVMSRKKMEEDLVRLSSIVENSPQFITIVSAGGGFVYYNAAAVEISGYSREELDNGGLGILLSEENYRYLREEIVPIVIKNKKHQYELPFLTKHGETHIMSVSAFRSESDATTIYSIASDITDLVMMQRELERRSSELSLQTAMLSTMFASLPDIVFCKDLDLNYTRCNKSFERFLGCREEDVIGKNEKNIFELPEDTLKQLREVELKVIDEKTAYPSEEYIPSASGELRLFETIRTPLIQNGKPTGLIGIARDITQRKMSEETLKLTLDNLDACVYISEINTGEILLVNNRMAEEYDDADCVGKKCWEVLQRDASKQCDFCPVPKLLESGDRDYVWEEHSTVTGKYYRNTDSIIKWHDGRLVHMQHAFDITDLINLQKDLENASKAKGDFLSRMSHEIRTPLNAVIGMIGIAMGTEDHGKIQTCLSKADNASKHLLGVINDILDMSKIEADKFELDSREFNFEKMLMNVTNVTNFRAEEKKQNFIVNINNNVPESIVADDLRLSQVLTNLLTNAVKFTPEFGTITLSIERIEDFKDEIRLRVEVKDTGIGISEEQQKRLFTSFEQADGGIARKFGGTGLGLAISKRIVELMDGKIWIESELGNGSKFIFTIRAGKGSKKVRAKLSEKINKEDMRILAVDDSFEIREYFTDIMQSFGLPCDVAENGKDALEMVKNCGQKPYNIFFIDWQMPEMDGIELTKRIKETAPDNSVVFMISVAEWSLIEKDALAVGVRSFISKPLFPSTLVNAINECMEIKPAKDESGVEGTEEKKKRDYSKHTILIAEDVEINREIMSAILEDTGIVIDYAENGVTAVSMFESNPEKYSLVLMDIHMPEMDGYEATRRIRALDLPQAKDTPIIAMTANVFKEDIENCLAAGMNDHIGKPIDTDDLFSKIEHYLR